MGSTEREWSSASTFCSYSAVVATSSIIRNTMALIMAKAGSALDYIFVRVRTG
jgi:hypothetical protein